jgi:hypothetical protein
MLQTFKAKSLANVCHNEKAIDMLVENSLSIEEVRRVAEECINVLKLSDGAHVGALSAHIIQRRLQRIPSLGLTANEVVMMCQSLPRNSLGLCLYESIRDVMYEVKFSCMKAVILDSQSSNIGVELSTKFQREIENLTAQFPDSFAIRTGKC